MSHNALKSGLVIALTVLAASSAAAQDGGWRKKGDGHGQAQAGEHKGGGGFKGGGRGGAGSGNSSSGGSSGTSTASTGSTSFSTQNYSRRYGTNTGGIDRRQDYQSDDIRWGQRRGLITESEARSLRAEQERIAEMERRAKADGSVTREERYQIRRAQHEAERHIREEMYDRERNGGYGHRRWGYGWRGWW